MSYLVQLVTKARQGVIYLKAYITPKLKGIWAIVLVEMMRNL
ncbi:hypothetical protein YB51_2465 [Streptococcus suis YB51]|nr:hypothetical protein YB51_2465 [Streptococcus suis YB51]